jgi:hypothetical protein
MAWNAKQISNLLLVTACLALSACGGGGGGAAAPVPTPVPSATVTGVAAKGLLLNGIVSFYSVTNGVAGTTVLTSVRTDAKTGAFSATVSSAGPVVVTLTVDPTTQMLDELSGVAIAAPTSLVLHTVFDSVTNLQPIAITPLTEMAYDIAKASAGALTTTNIDAANNAVGVTFLAGASVLYTQPIDVKNYASATAAEQEQEKLLVALAVAANQGIAIGSSRSPCAGSYSANIVCLVGGLGNLLTINSSGVITLASGATYISDAYTSIDSGTVTIDGGKAPSALGLNVVTAAETSFAKVVAKQAPLPGFDAGANPLANTKALFANIRTNILDQATTQTFGYAPTLAALENDYKTNVHPVASNTSSILSSAYWAVQLIQLGNGALGAASQYIGNPGAIASDSAGNLYIVNSNETIVKATGSSVVPFAGQAGVIGSANGPGAQASFTQLSAITVDSVGNVYVADNYAIREITPAGVVSTIAGQPGVPGSIDGTGSAASFAGPSAISVDASGNVYVADAGQAIRIVAPGGVVSTLTLTTSLSGYVTGIAVDGSDNMFVTEYTGIVQTITQAGVVSTLAGQLGINGYKNGAGSMAEFSWASTAVTIDASGNLYVVDAGNSAIREITPAGVVSTLIQTSPRGSPTALTSFGSLTGIALDPSGNVYVADSSHNSIQEINTAGAITTLVHGVANYQDGCGYDPAGLNTATNVVLCRYGLAQNQILLTVTQTATNTYSLQTQALVSSGSYNPVDYLSPLNGFAVVSTISPLLSTFTWTTSATGAQSGTLSGPYYVTASGGQVQASLSAAESSNWNATTDTGTITLGGTLSGGTGGVSLVNATIGSDSVITLQNAARLLNSQITPIISVGSPAVTIAGVIDLKQYITDAFSYAVKATIGAPILDKSKLLALPGTVSIAGSIDQIETNGTVPIFNGTIGVSVVGLPSFDATNGITGISAANYFTVQAQLDGTLSLPGGHVLTIAATANASQIVPTPALPDSITVTYSYTTPAGTAELNATGQYDATNGYTGTINNNSGVVITVTDPIGGTATGAVTANGVDTATIKGAFVYYSDGTSESLF